MSEQPPDAPHKEDKIGIRLDHDLAQKAREKAHKRGWSLSAVMRGFLTLWAADDEDVINYEEVGKASVPAPKRPRKPKPKPKRKKSRG